MAKEKQAIAVYTEDWKEITFMKTRLNKKSHADVVRMLLESYKEANKTVASA